MFPVEQFALKMNISINDVSDIKTLLEYQDLILKWVVEICNGDSNLAASKLGVTRKALDRKINAARNRSHYYRAHRVVNGQVQRGQRPKADDLKCASCGHFGSDLKHHYHHHSGYSPENYQSVVPLCTPCHGMQRSGRKSDVMPGLCSHCKRNARRQGGRDCKQCHAEAEVRRRVKFKEEINRLRKLVKEKT